MFSSIPPDIIIYATALAGALGLAGLAFWLVWLFEDVGAEFSRYDIRHVGLVYYIMLPLSRKLGHLPRWISRLPALRDYTAWAERNLAISGMDEIFSPQEYVGSHVLMLILGCAFPFLVYPAFIGVVGGAQIVGLSVLIGALAAFMPFFFLSQTISERNEQIFKGLPYFLDLLTLLVEAGMEFTFAIKRTTELLGGTALSSEMRRFSGDLELGRSREEALRELSDRVDLTDMKSFVTALLQQQELGTPLGDVLRTQAEIMRFRRVEAAEEKANKAPVKIMIPMILFIFPSIFLILVGPMLIRAGQTTSSTGQM